VNLKIKIARFGFLREGFSSYKALFASFRRLSLIPDLLGAPFGTELLSANPYEWRSTFRAAQKILA
jgi:hypothetical protein